jgi:hypothetical protein
VRSIKLPLWIERLAGTAPIAAPPHAFFLDAGRLTYGRTVRDGGQARLLEHATVELPPQIFQTGLLGGPLREERELDQPLADLLQRLSGPVEDASLILPDSWFRIAFAETGALPRDREQREEMLRWKLKRLVPFRVEELRIRGVAVTPLAQDKAGSQRLMLGFALDLLLTQLEATFQRAGIRLGRITNLSLSTLAAVDQALGPGLTALAVIRDEGYTLTFARNGEPVLHRFKGTAGEMPFAARERLVIRDLKMTHGFLAEHLPEAVLDRALLMAPPELEEAWQGWLEVGLDAPVESLNGIHLPVAEPQGVRAPGGLWAEVAPLAGAALKEVA